MARRKTEKPKRAGTGPVVRLLLLLLLVSLGWQLVRINRQVETAQAQKEELAEQVDALRADIADGGSQEKKEEIARDELGMVAPGERVFVVN